MKCLCRYSHDGVTYYAVGRTAAEAWAMAVKEIEFMVKRVER